MPIAASAPWTLTARLDSVDISAALTGEARIDIEEGAARTATIEIDVSGVINPTDYLGKAIEIDVNYEGQAVRLFTGRVDRPRVQVFVNALTLSCSDAMSATVNSLTRAQLDVVTGHVPHAAFVGDDATTTGAEYAEAAMAETLSVLELDGAGAWRVVPLAAKAAPDFQYDEGDVLDGSYLIDIADADRLENDLTVEVQAQRLRYWSRRTTVNYSWQYTFVQYLQRSRELPNRSMFEQAISQLGEYVYEDSLSFTFLPGSGLYYNSSGLPVPATVSGATDVTAFVNPFTELVQTATGNVETWHTQRVNLVASIQMQVATSIAAHGQHSASQTVRRPATENILDWEAAEIPASRPERPAPVAAGSFFYGDNTGLAEDQALLDAAVARGVRRLFEAHRKTSVTFTTAFHASAGVVPDTSHTIRVECTTGSVVNRAQGKASRVRHRFGFESNEAETTITLAICRGGEAGVLVPDSSYVTPTVDAALPPDSGTAGNTDNEVANHNQLGNEVGAVYDDTLAGYSGNWSQPYSGDPAVPLGPIFPRRLELQTLPIDAALRDTVDFSLPLSIQARLPEDLLEIEAL